MKVSGLMRLPACVVMLTALLLSACNSPEEKTAHITTQAASHYIIFSIKKTTPSQSELLRLDAFVTSVPVLAVSYVGLEADDTNPAALKRAKWIKAYLVKHGIDANTIHLEPVLGAYSTMLLTIEYSVAITPQHCPDWSKNAIANYDNTRFSNFGCSYYNNIVQQLSDPADFNGGQGTSQESGARESVTLQKYYLATPFSTGASSSGVSSSSGSSSGGTSGSSGGSSQ
jgi:type IV pilus biogenesis protein CpaD/CtpE